MIPDPTLHMVEAARRRLEEIVDLRRLECCLDGLAGVTCGQHDWEPDFSTDRDVETLRDVLDRLIEEKRAARDLQRAGVS